MRAPTVDYARRPRLARKTITMPIETRAMTATVAEHSCSTIQMATEMNTCCGLSFSGMLLQQRVHGQFQSRSDVSCSRVRSLMLGPLTQHYSELIHQAHGLVVWPIALQSISQFVNGLTQLLRGCVVYHGAPNIPKADGPPTYPHIPASLRCSLPSRRV